MSTPLPPFHWVLSLSPVKKAQRRQMSKGLKTGAIPWPMTSVFPKLKKNTVTPQLVRSDEIRADALPTATYAGQIELLETSLSSREHQLLYARSATNRHHRWDTPSQPEHPSVPFRHGGSCGDMRKPQIFFHTF